PAADAGRHVFTATLKTLGHQSLLARDAATASITGKQAGISVTHLAATITGPTLAVSGQPLTFILGSNETGSSKAFTYRIDWDGNGSVDQVVRGLNGLAVSHAFPASGIFTVRVGVRDSHGNASTHNATQSVTVQQVAL